MDVVFSNTSGGDQTNSTHASTTSYNVIPCTMIAQVNTLFVKQGTTLKRHIGPHFEIPPASLGAFVTLSMLISLPLYDRCFVKVMRLGLKTPGESLSCKE